MQPLYLVDGVHSVLVTGSEDLNGHTAGVALTNM
jgi:hypothetical protein